MTASVHSHFTCRLSGIRDVTVCWKAWAVSWLPTIATLLGAIAGELLARSMLGK